MPRVTAILSVAAVVLIAASLAAQAKPTFAGEWKLVVASGQGSPGVDLAITQTATAVTLEYKGGHKLTYKLDGSSSNGKVTWAGNNLTVTTTTSAGEEKRTISMDSGYLVVETSVPARNGGVPTITKVVYQPYQRGFGG